MKRYGEVFELTQDLMDTIAGYMDDEKREALHVQLAPCAPEVFLKAYVEVDPKFAELLKSEFDVEM